MRCGAQQCPLLVEPVKDECADSNYDSTLTSLVTKSIFITSVLHKDVN